MNLSAVENNFFFKIKIYFIPQVMGMTVYRITLILKKNG
jgi:hypothetical protein